MRNGLIGLGCTVVVASIMMAAACADYSASAGTGGSSAVEASGGSSSSSTPASGGASQSTSSSTPSSSGGTSQTSSSSTPSPSGGTSQASTSGAATGGSSSSSGSGGDACTSVTPCGGEVVGTWKVTSSCLNVSGGVDLSGLGTDCKNAVVASGSLKVTGTLTVSADGTLTDETTNEGDEELALPPSCQNVSGTTTTCKDLARGLPAIGYASGECQDDASTGGCKCSVKIQQSGGIGFVSTYASPGNMYTTADNAISIDPDGRHAISYSYCVKSSTLTMTPKQVKATITTGSIVLEKQ